MGGLIVFIALIIGAYVGVRFFIKAITYRPEIQPRPEPPAVPDPPEPDPPLIGDAAYETAEIQPEPTEKRRRKTALPKPPKPYRPKFDLEVVGEHHYQRNLKYLAGAHGPVRARTECTAKLIPEFNIHDWLSVRVEIEGLTVGHLSRKNARAYREWLDAKEKNGQILEIAARISGGYDRGDRWMEYSVWLDEKPFQ